jgi:hypothetical protein
MFEKRLRYLNNLPRAHAEFASRDYSRFRQPVPNQDPVRPDCSLDISQFESDHPGKLNSPAVMLDEPSTVGSFGESLPQPAYSSPPAAQARKVSAGELCVCRVEILKIPQGLFEHMARADISEFETYMPSRPVRSLRADFPACENHRHSRGLVRRDPSGRTVLRGGVDADRFAKRERNRGCYERLCALPQTAA